MFLVNEITEKYGCGNVQVQKCPTCDYEKEMHSAGVHMSEGSLRAYSEDDQFECLNCLSKDNPKEGKCRFTCTNSV